MEKTNLIAKNINLIFEVICIVYDDTEFNFFAGSYFVEKLKNSLEQTKTLDTRNIAIEIWNATSRIQRAEKINKLINLKFSRLLNWKPVINNIDDMNQELSKDLSRFYQKQIKINKKYVPADADQINRNYTAIGHRLFKAILDLKKVMAQLKTMIEDEAANSEHEEVFLTQLLNIKLVPEKKADFVSLLSQMCDNNYFIPVDNTIPFSKTIVFSAMGELLHSELEFVEIPDQKLLVHNNLNLSQNDKKSFPDFILHSQKQKLSEALKDEFKNEKAKSIRYLLEALERHQPPLISMLDRKKNETYKSMKEYFNRDIGSYNSIFQCRFNPEEDKIEKQDLEKVTIRLNHILKKI